jgi:hypothetical protein
LTYKKSVGWQQYAGHKPRHKPSLKGLVRIKTRYWGEVLYPKGTKPVVAEIKVGGSEPAVFKEGLGYKTPSDLEAIRKGLEIKAKGELAQDQKADIELKFPNTHRAPIKFSVVGEQPLRPRIINYPGGWGPPEGIVEDIKKELQNPKRKTASDVEVVAYLSSASLAFPLSEEWIRIYLYLARNYFKAKGWKKFDGSMSFLNEYKSLREDDKRELQRLKDWIFEQQKKDLAERQRQVRK